MAVLATVVALSLLAGGGFLGTQLWRQERDRQVAEAARIEHERQVGLVGQTVRGYFDAVARADAAAALAYGKEQPKASPLLTDEVLKAAVATAPVTDLRVEVGELTRNADGELATARVRAVYQIGGELVTRSWTLHKQGEDWKFAKATASVKVEASQVALKFNGATATAGTVELLPGAYRVTTDDTLFSLPDTTMMARGPGDDTSWSPSFVINPNAVNEAAKAVTASYRACVAKRDINDMYGCPFGFQPPDKGITLVAGTFRVVSKGNPFANPKLEQVDDLTYSVTESITISAVAQARQGSASGTLMWEERTYKVTATITLGSSEVLWT